MEIRKATLEDLPVIVELFEEFMTYHDDMIQHKQPRLEIHLQKGKDYLEKFSGWAKKNIEGKNSLINLAYVDGVPAGYSLIFIEDTIPIFKIKKVGHVGDLFVRQQFRGRGISSKFKELAFQWFKENKVKIVKIAVYPYNEHAYNIYKKWGFFDFHVEMRTELE